MGIGQLKMRSYRGEEDFWRVREFLREVFTLNGRRELSWQVCRWDYCRWHVFENILRKGFEGSVFIWEGDNGRIAAVLNTEGEGDVSLQVHPEARTRALEEEMILVAEEHLAVRREDGRRTMQIWTDSRDEQRRGLLSGRGYAVQGQAEHQRRRPMSLEIPDLPVPEGYSVRSLGGVEELPARSWLSWRAFHPDEPDEKYKGWDWYPTIQRCPMYRRDLDLVAVADDGELAAFCTVWFEDVNRTATFEPVGTSPEHQRRGLGKAVMYEGLRRAKRLGATTAYVGSYGPRAHALYESAGFTEYDLSEPWVREW